MGAPHVNIGPLEVVEPLRPWIEITEAIAMESKRLQVFEEIVDSLFCDGPIEGPLVLLLRGNVTARVCRIDLAQYLKPQSELRIPGARFPKRLAYNFAGVSAYGVKGLAHWASL